MAYVPDEDTLSGWVSDERLGRYRAAGVDVCGLYLWNAELSAACFQLIGHVEVLLRNAMHTQLARHSPDGRWYVDSKYSFQEPARRSIELAQRRALATGRDSPGRVVAELSFGFWRFLLTSHYQTTVWPRIAPGFTGVLRHERNRESFEAAVSRLHDLRNRVAHHEPVFHQPIREYIADALFIARHIDERAARMLEAHSSVGDVLESRPD